MQLCENCLIWHKRIQTWCLFFIWNDSLLLIAFLWVSLCRCSGDWLCIVWTLFCISPKWSCEVGVLCSNVFVMNSGLKYKWFIYWSICLKSLLIGSGSCFNFLDIIDPFYDAIEINLLLWFTHSLACKSILEYQSSLGNHSLCCF